MVSERTAMDIAGPMVFGTPPRVNRSHAKAVKMTRWAMGKALSISRAVVASVCSVRVVDSETGLGRWMEVLDCGGGGGLGRAVGWMGVGLSAGGGGGEGGIVFPNRNPPGKDLAW